MCNFQNKKKPMAGLDRARACGHFASIFKVVAKELHMLARIAIWSLGAILAVFWLHFDCGLTRFGCIWRRNDPKTRPTLHSRSSSSTNFQLDTKNKISEQKYSSSSFQKTNQIVRGVPLSKLQNFEVINSYNYMNVICVRGLRVNATARRASFDSPALHPTHANPILFWKLHVVGTFSSHN